MYDFKLNGVWIVIFVLCIFVFIYLIVIFIIILLEILENKFNIICICKGIRLNSRIAIPLFFICRRRRNRNITKIIPIPKIQTFEEYNMETGSIKIINPNNEINIGKVI
ncbi:MAG: hypothetical protein CMF96_05385 [Candidatus Marinimicrobia bacterium]|nr:hypothetical protein [Candidatus Neomarinimicrobiota bacterium]